MLPVADLQRAKHRPGVWTGGSFDRRAAAFLGRSHRPGM